MQWFGLKPWGPICDDCPRVDTPVGIRCARCAEAIEAGDDGVLVPALGLETTHGSYAYHWECNLRGVIGGANHLRGLCTCCGGTEPPDPPQLSRRQAAKLAVALWQLRGPFWPEG